MDDLEHEEDTGELQCGTLNRLCKRHRIAENQSVAAMVECLQQRKRTPLDGDAAIDSLHNVAFEDVEHLYRNVLLRLTHKKQKSKNKNWNKRKGKSKNAANAKR